MVLWCNVILCKATSIAFNNVFLLSITSCKVKWIDISHLPYAIIALQLLVNKGKSLFKISTACSLARSHSRVSVANRASKFNTIVTAYRLEFNNFRLFLSPVSDFQHSIYFLFPLIHLLLSMLPPKNTIHNVMAFSTILQMADTPLSWFPSDHKLSF